MSPEPPSEANAPKPRRISQAEVARRAGVSRATASLVLRGGFGAAAATRETVLKVARELGYRPNSLVHSIRSGRSRTMGVLVHPYDSFWTQVLYGIHDRLLESNILPLILWDREHRGGISVDDALAQIHRMLDRWVDGAILWPHFAQLYSEHVGEFSSRNLPVVTIDHVLPPASRADAVVNNEADIAAALIRHLAHLGHARVALLITSSRAYWSRRRVQYLSRTAREHRPRIALELIRADRVEDAAPALETALRRADRPTAVIAGTDHYAPVAYAVARAIGLHIPQDLSVVGVGDLEESRALWPPLTSYRQDGYAIGRQAAESLLERSRGGLNRRYPTLVRMKGTLIVRGSTAPAVSPSRG